MTEGMLLASRGMSARSSAGMHLRASGSSGVSCFSLSARVFSTRASTAASSIEARFAVILACSSASMAWERLWSGVSSTVTRWGLLRRYFLMRGPNTSSPDARRALNDSRGSVKRMGWKGSRSYSQLLIERSMRLRPRGKRPVLFSRRENSIELTLASMAAASKPVSARSSSVLTMSASSLGTSSLVTPFMPTANVGCRSSSSSPEPVRDSPRPLSVRALRKGEAWVPSMRWSRKEKASSVSRSKASSSRSQLTVKKFFSSPSAAT
mmetsp:Transcript_37170/g.116988  ORF Transcript_37170/g.116988 Transcript_37170/m.116988 type:complete len:266 (-) Transcript_37170:1576-2373(-)